MAVELENRRVLDQVEHDVRELVRRRGLDPTVDPAVIRAVVDEVVSEHEERAARGTLAAIEDPDAVAKHVHDAVAGLGPLQRYLDDPTIEEIWINDRLTTG